MAFSTELDQFKKKKNLYGDTEVPEWSKQSWERKTELEESVALASDYTTKLWDQTSMELAQKQTYIHSSMGQDRKPEINTHVDGWLVYEKRGTTI